MMDSVTCCYLFGHKDLVESHLKAAARSGCREGQGHEGVRWWQGGVGGAETCEER